MRKLYVYQKINRKIVEKEYKENTMYNNNLGKTIINEELLQYTTIKKKADTDIEVIEINHPRKFKMKLETYHALPGITVIVNESDFMERFTDVNEYFEYNHSPDLLMINYFKECQGQLEMEENKFIPLKNDDVHITFYKNFKPFSFYGKTVSKHLLVDKEIILREKNCYTSQCKQLIRDLFEYSSKIDPIILKTDNKIKKIVCETKEMHFENNTIFAVFNQVKIIETLIILYSTILHYHPIEHSTYTDAQIRVVRKIKNHLSRDIASYISLEVLSCSYGINLTTLKNCFRDMYGQPLYNWYREYKFKRAKELIKNTDYPISKIAHMVGYKSSSKFAKAFKKETGVLPSSYRKNKSKNNEK